MSLQSTPSAGKPLANTVSECEANNQHRVQRGARLSPRSFRVPKCLNTATLGAAGHFAGLAAHQIGGVLEKLGGLLSWQSCPPPHWLPGAISCGGRSEKRKVLSQQQKKEDGNLVTRMDDETRAV